MGKYAQLVIGPAGSGKSTYVEHLHQHCQSIRRSIHCVNLDPAAEAFGYPVSIDIRDLISLEDVMSELQLGPNGGLLYCMEYLEDNLDDWLATELESYGDDDYMVFDCPGQIELYSHVGAIRSLVDHLKSDGWNVAAVFCMDVAFVSEPAKYIAGAMQALAAMVKLELPHINLLTKMDLAEDKQAVQEFLIPDPQLLMDSLSSNTGPKFRRLNAAVAGLIDEYSLVSFVPLDISDEESIGEVLLQIDMAIQYGEDADVKIKDFEEPDRDDNAGGGFDEMD